MIGGQNCISSCNGPCPCPYCSCSKYQLSEIGLVCRKRTRERIELLAHTLVGGTCPACDKKIVKHVMDKTKEVAVCERNCVHPEVPANKKGRGITHLILHEGIVPGQTVNFHLEPDDWTMCLLHAGLCIVGGLLQKTLLNHIDELVDPAATELHGIQLHALFSSAGCYMKVDKLKKKSKNLGKHDLAFKGIGLTGRSGEIVYRVREQVATHTYTSMLTNVLSWCNDVRPTPPTSC